MNWRACKFLPFLTFCGPVYRRGLDKHIEKIQMLSNRKYSDGVKPRLSALSMIFIGCGPQSGPRPLTAGPKTGHILHRVWF